MEDRGRGEGKETRKGKRRVGLLIRSGKSRGNVVNLVTTWKELGLS